MSSFTLIFSIILALTIFYIGKMIIFNFILPKPQIVPPGPKPQIVDVLSEIKLLVKLEVVGVIDIPQAVKNAPLISDFDKTQKEIVYNVLQSLNPSFWNYAARSGIDRRYIITYTTRLTHAEMIDFMEHNNFTLK